MKGIFPVMNRLRTAVASAACLGVGLALVPSAFAWSATAKCDTATGTYVVTPTNLDKNPVVSYEGGVPTTVTWSTGLTKPVKILEACPAQPPTPPQPEVVPPPVPPVPEVPGVTPPPTQRLTCADLADLYPKAGRKYWIAWGCPQPLPQKPDKPKPPKRVRLPVDCQFILGHYSGTPRANMLRKYGFKNCGVPYNPPVTG